MVDVEPSTDTPHDSARPPHQPAARTTAEGGGHVGDNGDDDGEYLDIEPSAPPLSLGNSEGKSGAAGGRRFHPLLRAASSSVDDKVDDWVRSSRHRLLADASVDSAPDLCLAMILYKPLPGAAGDGDEDGSGGEGGGDPTPSPRSDGDETSVSAARTHKQAAASGVEQCAGSGTAEAKGSTGGGGSSGLAFNGGDGVNGGIFGARNSAACVAPSGGDDAGGAMSDGSEGEDAMDTTTAEDDDSEPGQEMPAEPAVLTRMGTSRGAPTPELTPEWAARARVSPVNVSLLCWVIRVSREMFFSFCGGQCLFRRNVRMCQMKNASFLSQQQSVAKSNRIDVMPTGSFHEILEVYSRGGAERSGGARRGLPLISRLDGG